jgi:NADH-quinone oxidoreductase subunit G
VLPRENESVNECWLADRDRFSYEAITSDERLLRPMIRRGNKWEETDWATALEFAVAGLKKVVAAHGAGELGGLAAPTATLEEFFLLQKLLRGLGSGNVDHRLRQMDFSDDAVAPSFPYLGQAIADLEQVDAALLIGSNLRKDQPLLNVRLRKAALKGARVMLVNPVDYAFNYRIAERVITDPVGMEKALAGIAAAVAKSKGASVPADIAALAGGIGAAEPAIAAQLLAAKNATVLLGNLALSHPHAARLKVIAQFIADTVNAKLGLLPEANSAGAWLAGCVSHRGVGGTAASVSGRNALDMLRTPLKAYVLVGVEPEFDCLSGAKAVSALHAAEFVVMLTLFKPSAYKSQAVEYADVWLPLAAFAETAGTFVNAAGQPQPFQGVTAPPGEARPGWKILRMLGSLLNLAGFEAASIDDVRRDLALGPVAASARLSAQPPVPKTNGMSLVAGQLMRIAEVPPYAVDAYTRRAPALAATADNPRPAARMHPEEVTRFGFSAGAGVRVVMQEGEAKLEVVPDARVPRGCVLIPSGYPETANLGAHGPATMLKEGA